MENPSATAVIAIADKQEFLTSRSDEFLEFYRDFEKRLSDLNDALRNTQHIKKLAASLQAKGAVKNFCGSLSGRNDKDLAQMVEELGASTETTQVILQLVMKVQNTKNRFLREFHMALVDKVSLIENDTATLDVNQRQAAIAIVSELRDQVAAQLEQQALVESHQRKLQLLDGYVARKEAVDHNQDEKIRLLESRAMEIIRTDQEQQQLIEELRAADASKDELDRIQTQRIDMLMTVVTELELDAEKHQRTVDLFESQQGLLIQQLRAMEAANYERVSLRAVILRNLLPGAAFMLGMAALLVSLLVG